MKSDSGKWKRNRIDILETATSYYKKLYGNSIAEEEIDLVEISNSARILQAEVEKAIDNQRLDKISYPHEKKSSPLKVKKGVREGDPLSPKLYSAVLESIIWKDYEINVDGISLTRLKFADDIVLFAKTPEAINKVIEDLALESEVGLKLNPKKTRVMTNVNKVTIQSDNTEIS
ncbi:Putative uncharacterized transposon-derived protein F52C9.6 [Eumeta japonica]|uniref:Uncharacterized transposon-derived protein F52C9.6 n=1 Tax=Eumeta variegata TaxID=151549 RepID=A0A4C1UAE2_EUMVA|nr:Putative uncharacterized transposon-derived protein F52C9.6 [Eumeta japonica]